MTTVSSTFDWQISTDKDTCGGRIPEKLLVLKSRIFRRRLDKTKHDNVSNSSCKLRHPDPSEPPRKAKKTRDKGQLELRSIVFHREDPHRGCSFPFLFWFQSIHRTQISLSFLSFFYCATKYSSFCGAGRCRGQAGQDRTSISST